MQTSSSGEQLLELTTQASSLTSQQVTTLASILASLTSGAPPFSQANNGSLLALAGTEMPANMSSNLLSEQQLNAISEDDELKLLNFPSKREDLSTAIPLTVIFALLLVTGCIGNICTAIVIARPKNKYMHTATNYYLFSLAMSDFLFLILGLPQEMYTLWQRYPYAFGESFCIIRGYLSEASTYASILTISAFTVERYVAICHPLWAHTMSQLPRAITSIVVIWCLAAICAIPPAAELGIVTQRGPLTNRTLDQSAQCATKRTIYENMFVVSAIVFFIVPMVIVTVLYILIAIELRRSSRMNNAISKQTSSHLYSQQSTTTTNGNSSLTGRNRHHHHCCHHHNHNTNHHHHHHNHHHQKYPHNYQPIAKPRSHQQLVACNERHKAVDEKRAEAHDDGHLLADQLTAERPQSAIGNEHATANCCLLASDSLPGAGQHVKSPTLSSLARLQLPLASKLYNQLLGAGFWSGYNLTATSAGLDDDDEQAGKRCESAFSCRLTPASEKIETAARPNEAASRMGLKVADEKHAPLSRQHSPLSYHESLIQRGNHHHHSAVDMSNSAPGANCHHAHHLPCSRPLNKHGPPHHQLSLAQLSTNQQQQRQMLLLNHQQHNFKPFQASQPQHQQQHSRRSNAASSKKSVIRMLVAVVVSFFICWVPFHAQRLLASYLVKDENQNQLLLDIYLKLTYISGVMYYLSSTINPLLYQLMSAKFRLAFKETFKCSLFKCAIFRRASTATTGTNMGLNHSPTNSIRNNEPHHHNNNNNNHPHLACAACPCELASARARFMCDADSRLASPSTGAHKQPASLLTGSRVDLQTNQVADQDQNRARRCCCCCCQTTAGLHQHQSAPPATSVLGRFRGQLNASLTSLLRLAQFDQPNQDRLQTSRAGDISADCNCACCSSGAQQQHDRSQRGATNVPANRHRQLMLESSNCSLASRSCSPAPLGGSDAQTEPVATSATVELDAQVAPMTATTGRPAAASVNEHHQHEWRPRTRDHSIKSTEVNGKTSADTSHLSQVASLQTNFPAHHTMLKFIRSPTPTSLNGQPLPSLTRLSSREEDEDDQELDVDGDDVGSGSKRKQMAPNSGVNKHLALNNDEMRALIRPTRQDDEFGLPDGHDESEPLACGPLASGNSSNDASRAQSSMGSSPDQLASTSQSTTNQARTTSTSSSSSLALLAGHDRDRTTTKTAANRKLVASKSVASARTNNSNKNNQRQHRRRASWQTNQTGGHLTQCQLDMHTNGHNIQMDQNGNTAGSQLGSDRDHCLTSSLSSSETMLDLRTPHTKVDRQTAIDSPDRKSATVLAKESPEQANSLANYQAANVVATNQTTDESLNTRLNLSTIGV